MSNDPRLRLLGEATSEVGEAVLRRLDETTLVVQVGRDADRAALVAAAAFVAMIARLFPRVVVHSENELPVNWWGADCWDDLLVRLAAVRPQTEHDHVRQVTVGFGSVDTPCDLYVGGGDWNVLLGIDPVELEDGNDHALGVHAAGCLATSQVLIRVLADIGFPGVAATGPVTTNLIDHGLHAVHDDMPGNPPHLADEEGNGGTPRATSRRSAEVRHVAFAGVGSVGTSALALLATACSPVLNPGSRLGDAVQVTAIDKDTFDPGRNPYRYPALLGGETSAKAIGMTDRLCQLGIAADPRVSDVATWNQTKDQPGWHGVLISSVDTIPGRFDVADVLAERTLSAGVAGTALHIQWERFADGYACPFCDFVAVDPPLTQAGVYSQVTGLPVQRVLTLLQDGAVLGAADVEVAIAAGRLNGDRRDALVGAPLSDLIRQAYAEAEVRGTGAAADADVVAVAAPQVSWFAGVLLAAEVIKDLLGLPLVRRRVDVDVAGLPAGLVRVIDADTTGTCVCWSGVRARWYRQLYDRAPQSVSSSAVSSPTLSILTE